MTADSSTRKTKIRLAMFAVLTVALVVGFLIGMHRAQQKQGHVIEMQECGSICTDTSTEKVIEKPAPPASSHPAH